MDAINNVVELGCGESAKEWHLTDVFSLTVDGSLIAQATTDSVLTIADC